MTTTLQLDLSPEFSYEEHDLAEQRDRDNRQKATAQRTRARIEARRANSEATLAEILPAEIATGDAWHVISSGDIDSLSYLAHLLKTTRMDYVALSTWCMAMEDIKQLAAWLADGTITRLDAYVGEIFPNQYSAEHAALSAIVRPAGGRVCVFRNHSKIFLCRARHRGWVIESSANINTNPRTENTTITADAALYRHHLAYFNGVRSFERHFDDWTPPHD